MKKKYLINLIIIITFCSHVFSQVDVTFSVDMSSETISADGIHIVGSLNNWSTDSTTLTQEGTTNIYTTTLQLNSGWYEYKFLNGNSWGTEESASLPCAPSNGNRFLYINDSGLDVTLVTVPFNGCNDETTGFSVTLNVDMSSEGSISENGVHLVGSLNGWSTDNLQVADNSGDTYSTTLRLPTPADYPVVFEYKYLNGNAWGAEETPAATCGTVVNTNRLVTVETSGKSINDIFNGCTATLNVSDFNLADALLLTYNKEQRLLNFSSNNTSNTISKIQVVDINGRTVKELQLINALEDTSIDFKMNANGLYFVQIKTDNKAFVKKVLIY